MEDESAQYERLTAYLDGELSPEEREDVEQMLRQDVAAQRLLRELRETIAMVASLPRSAAPADLAEGVTARMEREALLGEAPGEVSRGAGRVRWWRGVAAAAAIAIVVTAGWVILPELPIGRGSGDSVFLAENEGPGDAEDGASKQGMEMLGPQTLAMSDHRSDRTLPSSLKPRAPDTITAAPGAAAPEVVVSSVRAAKLARHSPGAKDEGPPTTSGEGLDVVAALRARKTAVPARGSTQSSASPASKSPHSGEAPADAAPASVDIVSANLDELLGGNVLANCDLREFPVSEYSRKVVAATDEETQAALLRHIVSFMGARSIPDVGVRDLPEPIGSSQAYYLVRSQRGKMGVTGGELKETEGADVMMNLPREEALDLLTTMADVARRREAVIAWSAGDRPLPGPDRAPDAVRAWLVANGGLPARQAGEGGFAGGAYDRGAADGRRLDKRKQPSLADAEEADRDDPAERSTRVGKGARRRERGDAGDALEPGGARGKGGAAIKSSATESFVALAISLRAGEMKASVRRSRRVSLEAEATTTRPARDAGSPTTHPARDAGSAATRPAPKGADGG